MSHFDDQPRRRSTDRDEFERGFDEHHRTWRHGHLELEDGLLVRDDDHHTDFRGDFDGRRRFNPDYGSELRGEFHERSHERGEPRGVVYRRFARSETIDPERERREFESHEWGRTEQDLRRQLRDDRERWLDEMEFRRSRRRR